MTTKMTTMMTMTTITNIFPGREKQKGVVLIAVLALAALAAAFAMEIAYKARMEGERVALSGDQIRSELMAEAGYSLALDVLAADSSGIDSADDAWAKPLIFSRPEGDVKVTITDESARFPLNSLFDNTGLLNIGAKTRFERLVEMLSLSSNVVDLILDYMDANSEPFPRGAEKGEYAAMDPPGRPADRMMFSLDELSQVYGLDTTAVDALSRVSTVYGASTININTAGPEVIASLSPDISLDEGGRVQSRSKFSRYSSVGDVADVVEISPEAKAEVQAHASVASTVFRIVSEGNSGHGVRTITTIVQRQTNDFAIKYRRVE